MYKTVDYSGFKYQSRVISPLLLHTLLKSLPGNYSQPSGIRLIPLGGNPVYISNSFAETSGKPIA